MRSLKWLFILWLLVRVNIASIESGTECRKTKRIKSIKCAYLSKKKKEIDKKAQYHKKYACERLEVAPTKAGKQVKPCLNKVPNNNRWYGSCKKCYKGEIGSRWTIEKVAQIQCWPVRPKSRRTTCWVKWKNCKLVIQNQL